jgi:hypothetical protein
MSTNYQVIFGSFVERYYIKSFAKKYKGAWDSTFKALSLEFKFIDALFLKKVAETIVDSETVKICKIEFKISGTQDSRHGSGNRCIVAVHKNIQKVCVLLVYHKNDLGGGNETAKWQEIIKENYPEYRGML